MGGGAHLTDEIVNLRYFLVSLDRKSTRTHSQQKPESATVTLLEKTNTDMSNTSDVQKSAKELFKTLFGRKRTTGGIIPGIKSKTHLPNQNTAASNGHLPKINHLGYEENDIPLVPTTLSHPSKEIRMEKTYQIVLEILHRFLQKSQCNEDLANCVGFEVRTFLKQVVCSKTSAEQLIQNLTSLFEKFQILKEISLDEGQRNQIIRYIDLVRDKQTEIFQLIKVDLEKRFPSILRDNTTVRLHSTTYQKIVADTNLPSVVASSSIQSLTQQYSSASVNSKSTNSLCSNNQSRLATDETSQMRQDKEEGTHIFFNL